MHAVHTPPSKFMPIMGGEGGIYLTIARAQTYHIGNKNMCLNENRIAKEVSCTD